MVAMDLMQINIIVLAISKWKTEKNAFKSDINFDLHRYIKKNEESSKIFLNFYDTIP
jgi:hypothetical protein